MKKDILYIVLFILTIVGIVTLTIYNTRKPSEVVDRKVVYYFNKYTYSSILKKSEILLDNTYKLYTQNLEFDDKDYMINSKKYKKIINGYLISSTFYNSEDYIKDNNIEVENNCYYLIKKDVSSKLVGHMLEVKDYTDSEVTIESLNYYCDNSKYEGLLSKEPSCSYTTKTSSFKIVIDQELIKIKDYKEVINIM